MKSFYYGGNPLSLDLSDVFGATLEPAEALLLNTFLKFDQNDDGLLQLDELEKALNYISLPGEWLKKKLSNKDINEVNLKAYVLFVKFMLAGAEEGKYNTEISLSVADEIFSDSNLVFNPFKDSEDESSTNDKKIDINEFIDKIQEGVSKNNDTASVSSDDTASVSSDDTASVSSSDTASVSSADTANSSAETVSNESDELKKVEVKKETEKSSEKLPDFKDPKSDQKFVTFNGTTKTNYNNIVKFVEKFLNKYRKYKSEADAKADDEPNGWKEQEDKINRYKVALSSLQKALTKDDVEKAISENEIEFGSNSIRGGKKNTQRR